MAFRKIELQHAFVLHTHPWRETSLLLDVFSHDYGRLALIAKGARRPSSGLRGVLMSFQPLLLSWSGKADVKILVQAEWQGGLPLLSGVGQLCAYYLNELLMRLLPKEEAHAVLYQKYAFTLKKLSVGEKQEPLLRAFEITLLEELGYIPSLSVDSGTNSVVDPDGMYSVVPDVGVVAWQSELGVPVQGRVLQAMVREDYSEPETLNVSKLLTRKLLSYRLQGQELSSRRILMDLQRV